MLSRRTAVRRSPNRVAAALEAARADGRLELDLTESNPTRVGLPYPGDAIREALAAPGVLDHAPAPLGLPEARAAVARELSVDPALVVLTASTSEAYGFLFKLLCDPGDEVLVPRPSYPLLELLARFDGVSLSHYPLGFDGAFHLDVDALARARTPRSRAALLVSPNNPTGHYLRREERDALLDLDLPIVCDEVFAGYPHRADPERVPTLAGGERGLTFSLGGLSKHVGLPQLKLGWIVVGGEPARATEALARLEILADASLSVGAPVQLAVGALLETGVVTRRAIAERVVDNAASLRRALAGTAASVLPIEGGWYAVVRLPDIQDAEAWVLELLGAGVAVQPGWFYDFDREAFVVASLLCRPEVLREGAARIAARVAAATG